MGNETTPGTPGQGKAILNSCGRPMGLLKMNAKTPWRGQRTRRKKVSNAAS